MFTHPVASVRCRSGLRRARSLPGIDRLRTLLKQASAVRSPALTVALSCEDVVTDHYLLGLGASSLIRRLRGRLYRRFRRRRLPDGRARPGARPSLQARSDCTVAQRRAGEEGGRRAEPAQLPPQDARSPSHRRRRPAGAPRWQRHRQAPSEAPPRPAPIPTRSGPQAPDVTPHELRVAEDAQWLRPHLATTAVVIFVCNAPALNRSPIRTSQSSASRLQVDQRSTSQSPSECTSRVGPLRCLACQ